MTCETLNHITIVVIILWMVLMLFSLTLSRRLRQVADALSIAVTILLTAFFLFYIFITATGDCS